MASDRVPVVDLSPWHSSDSTARRQLADRVDRALQSTGFLLVAGEGITPGLPGLPDLPDRVRAAAHDFFHLPPAVKERYVQNAGRRGWIGRERVAAARSEGGDTPPDLLEVWSCTAGSAARSGGVEKLPRHWPDEVPALLPLVTEYTERMRVLADTVLEIMATALGLPVDFLTRHTVRPHWDFTINWYPPVDETGPAAPGQFRVGPHTDFGLITILDRQPGKGGLQIHDDEEGWRDAPHRPGTVTLNIGDLMARWSGDRWRSGRHRVLPPPSEAPQEELISLVYFHACAPETSIASLPAPLGRRSYAPVLAGEYFRSRLESIHTTK
ncbi:isopenicillin N synthase family oxygenase [Streptomyces qinzhouensis]|uniref:Isopenicillin N synthase family oxygenase n=2 Tax=Streptomyces qinzhouensis TaxID=2599401 RepID=A0A5B8JTH1_9ACTN|nr:isopenicillin N synthase family oxygenase [Streptomyces qinzhouensis]